MFLTVLVMFLFQLSSKGSDFKALKERDEEYKRQVNYIQEVFQ